MNDGHDTKQSTDVQPQEQPQQPIPIEVKWNIPSWLMRFPGPQVPIEDDDVAFEEGQVQA